MQNLPTALQFASGVFDMGRKNAFPLICGGSSNTGSVINSCWKLEQTGNWNQISGMKYERSHFTLNAINGTVIAVGGQNSSQKTNIGIKSTESFNYLHWSDDMIEDIPVRIHHHCTVTYNSTLLIVLGGQQNGEVSTKVA